MRNNWSLVLFTLSVQSAVGSVWCVQAALFWSGGLAGFLHLKFQIIAALFLALVGLAVAMAHLGKPGNSPHVVKNVKSSWLSREIFSVSLFTGFLAVMAALSHIHPAVLKGWMMLGGSLTGGATLYAMTRVYLLRTVPSWNHAGTPLNFLGSALLLGGLLCALVLQTLIMLHAVGHDAMGLDEYRNIAFIAALIGFILKTLAAGVSPSEASSHRSYKALLLMQGFGVSLWLVYILSGGNLGSQSIFLYLAAVSLFAGEIIHRIQFYGSYQRVGL